MAEPQKKNEEKEAEISKWVGKILSLIIAIGVWFAIFTQQKKSPLDTPVPGTDVVVPRVPAPPVLPAPAIPPAKPPVPPVSVIPGQ